MLASSLSTKTKKAQAFGSESLAINSSASMTDSDRWLMA
jgi:hypothetical protein